MGEQQFASVDDYIDMFPDEVQLVLSELRTTIRAEAPAAAESITYHMPTYTVQERSLVFFAGWKTHVALYAIPAFDGDGEGELEAELAPYRSSKDTLKFSLRQPVPYPLVARVVRALVERRGSE